MSFHHSPRIVTNGLQIYLDAANPKSYSGDGSIWRDLSGNHNDASLYGPCTYNTNYKGSINFDGSTQYAILPNIDTYSTDAIFTLNANFRSIAGNVCKIYHNEEEGANTYFAMYTSGSKPGIFIRISGTLYSHVPLTSDIGWGLAMSLFLRINKQTDTANYYIRLGQRAGLLTNIMNETVSAGTNTSFDRNQLGGWSSAGPEGATFDMYSFMIYNRWLSDAEVLQNCNALKSRFGL